jgi:hypothetical protein
MGRKKRRKKRAQRADRHDLYEKAVQEPEADIDLVRRIYKNRFARPPRLMREDFCGTAYFAAEWIKRHPENRAWAIDLDPVPLDWGRDRHIAKLEPEQAARVKLIEGNVLDVGHEKVDVTVAFNFSYFLFDTRDALRRYFEKARATLLADGVLVLDAYGGADSMRPSEEPREVEDFTYVWEQHSFDSITHRVRNYIHFEFDDGSQMRRAFRYDWRLWSLPEIREVLAEAGFHSSQVYWEGTDQKTGEGNGIFRPRESAPEDPAWIAYIAAYR